MTRQNNIKISDKSFTVSLTVLIVLFSFLLTMQVDAQRDEKTVAANWNFDDGSAKDSSTIGLNGTFVGNPQSDTGIVGKALTFNGSTDGINIPDSTHINTGGPYTDRTIAAFFKCTDITKTAKQVIFQEGGATRGLCIYVHAGSVYVGGWNRAQYNWEGTWLSEKINANHWHHVALVLRDTTDKVENDKFEMWFDGKLADADEGGQLYSHTNNTSIGYVTQKSIFHDGTQDLSNVDWFTGAIDEVIVYNSAFVSADFNKIAQPLNVEPNGKFTTTWGHLKSKRMEH